MPLGPQALSQGRTCLFSLSWALLGPWRAGLSSKVCRWLHVGFGLHRATEKEARFRALGSCCLNTGPELRDSLPIDSTLTCLPSAEAPVTRWPPRGSSRDLLGLMGGREPGPRGSAGSFCTEEPSGRPGAREATPPAGPRLLNHSYLIWRQSSVLCHSQGITMGTRLTLNTVFLPEDFFLSNPAALGDLSNCYSPAGSSVFCLQKLLRRLFCTSLSRACCSGCPGYSWGRDERGHRVDAHLLRARPAALGWREGLCGEGTQAGHPAPVQPTPATTAR